jgi:hypothetical protein
VKAVFEWEKETGYGLVADPSPRRWSLADEAALIVRLRDGLSEDDLLSTTGAAAAVEAESTGKRIEQNGRDDLERTAGRYWAGGFAIWADQSC